MRVPDGTPLPSVADVLELAELRTGDPELIAGRDGLQRPVRWAHVVAGAPSVRLLDGGELALTTGAGWPQDAEELEELAEDLVGAGPAAIVLELGRFFEAAPAELVAACDRARIPLVVLHDEVRFVQITQRVHQRILAAQTDALEARAEVHAMLTELGLNRSPVDYVIERIGEVLDAPVVLEDSAGRVVAWSGTGSHVLEAWAAEGGFAQSASRAHDEGAGPDRWERVPVEAQGRRWGTLTALPGPPHPAGRRTVLELGAFALALGRLADLDCNGWLHLSSKRMLDALLHGRYLRDEDLARQLAAHGLPVTDRRLFGMVLRGDRPGRPGVTRPAGAPLAASTGGTAGGLALSAERQVLETAMRRAAEPLGRVVVAPADDDAELLALVSLPRPGRGASPGDAAAADELERFVSRLATELNLLLPPETSAEWRARLSIGAESTGVRQLITSLGQVRASGAAEGEQVGRVLVQRSARRPLATLVRGLAGTPEVQQFWQEALGPLIEHDAARGPGHSGDLLRVLDAYLAHPTNRSLAAERARLSRSVFYQRLDLIEDLLDVSLADGRVIAMLTVAMLARG